MLVVVLMSMMLMTSLGTALALTTLTEMTIAGNYREATEAFYAAEAAVEWAIHDLSASDWNAVTTTEPYVAGRLAEIIPAAADSRMRVSVRVTRPPPAENDLDAGLEVLVVVGEAYGTGGSRRAIEITLAREAASDASDAGPIHVLYWRELT